MTLGPRGGTRLGRPDPAGYTCGGRLRLAAGGGTSRWVKRRVDMSRSSEGDFLDILGIF